jgi:hypothetical protein
LTCRTICQKKLIRLVRAGLEMGMVLDRAMAIAAEDVAVGKFIY